MAGRLRKREGVKGLNRRQKKCTHTQTSFIPVTLDSGGFNASGPGRYIIVYKPTQTAHTT